MLFSHHYVSHVSVLRSVYMKSKMVGGMLMASIALAMLAMSSGLNVLAASEPQSAHECSYVCFDLTFDASATPCRSIRDLPTAAGCPLPQPISSSMNDTSASIYTAGARSRVRANMRHSLRRAYYHGSRYYDRDSSVCSCGCGEVGCACSRSATG